MINSAQSLAVRSAMPATDPVENARELKQAYGQFVGETLFGSMLKSMRATVGEPAYFHGGSAERHFQARLDQQIAIDLAEGQGATLSQKLFEQQFPAEAELLREHAAQSQPEGLDSLNALRRY